MPKVCFTFSFRETYCCIKFLLIFFYWKWNIVSYIFSWQKMKIYLTNCLFLKTILQNIWVATKFEKFSILNVLISVFFFQKIKYGIVLVSKLQLAKLANIWKMLGIFPLLITSYLSCKSNWALRMLIIIYSLKIYICSVFWSKLPITI